MLLSLTQAAQLLGKSRRQIEYLIKQGRLRATKNGGRWQVDEADLPLSPGQRQAIGRRAAGLRQAAAEVLDGTAPRPRYSMADLHVFASLKTVWQNAEERLATDHPARGHLRAALDQIAIGCHRYLRRDKALAYHAARDALSLAACALLLDDDPERVGMAAGIEQEVIPALAGLLRRAEGKRP
jgi:excisionase family DNA binding protein